MSLATAPGGAPADGGPAHDDLESRIAPGGAMSLPDACRRYLDQLVDPCLILDDQVRVVAANPAWLRLVGAESDQELLGRLAGNRSPAIQPDGVPSEIKAVRAAEQVLQLGSAQLEWTAYGPGSKEIRLEVTGSRISLDSRTWIHVTGHDISHRITIEERLREQSRFQEMVAAIAARFIHGTADDLDSAIEDALRQTAEYYSADRAWVFLLREGNQYFDQTHEWRNPDVPPVIHRFQNQPVSSFPTLFDRGLRGQPFYFSDVDEIPDDAVKEREECYETGIQSVLALPLMTGGTVYGMMGLETVLEKRTWSEHQIALLRVIPELIAASFVRWQAQEELQRLADTDGLTGLANRRQFDGILEREFRRLARRQQRLSLILFDIDAFKPYNDHYGHLAGDDCLRAIARAVRGVPGRTADSIARYGGEEFVCVAPETEPEGARVLAERMRRAVENLAMEHATARQGDRVTASFGVASGCCRSGQQAEDLLSATDRALYRAKARGGNCVELIDLDAARDE